MITVPFSQALRIIGSRASADPGILPAPNVSIDTPVWGNTTLTAAWEEIEFGAQDFILPGDVTRIEENVFEGIAAGTVYIPDSCVKISTGAFMNCPNLSRIRVPADCEIEEYAFEGCENLYVFSAPESKAKWHCLGHDNCTFVAEAP